MRATDARIEMAHWSVRKKVFSASIETAYGGLQKVIVITCHGLIHDGGDFILGASFLVAALRIEAYAVKALRPQSEVAS